MQLSKAQKESIQKILDGKRVDIQKMFDYLESHDIVSVHVFEECNTDFSLATVLEGVNLFSKNRVRGFYPVPGETFIRRLPLYYDQDNQGRSLRSWIVDLFYHKDGIEGREEELVENVYELLEFFYYEKGLSVGEVMRYSYMQLHRDSTKRDRAWLSIAIDFDEIEMNRSDIETVDFLYQWADYLKLCQEVGGGDPFPERFISAYNDVLERTGQRPIIYGFSSKSNDLDIIRDGRTIAVKGHFPCDGLGRPIMKWIGIRTENVERITCTCEKSRFGELRIQIKPNSMIYVLEYSDADGNLTDPGDKGAICAWEQEYAGPLNMVFNNEALKKARTHAGMTQREVADAIGASIRTYQKWENGETKPDCQYLLRIMNWLEIEDTQYLITYGSKALDEEGFK